MNYIVFDLEWNQPYTITPAIISKARYPITNEIIQIGAVKLNHKLEEIDRFNRLIKPEILTTMHKNVQRLTGYTMERLHRAGRNFKSVYESFIDWAGDDFTLVTWGPDDMMILQENVIISDTKEYIKAPWVDGQVLFKEAFPEYKDQVALSKAMGALNLEHNREEAHDGLVDALWTAEICRNIPFANITKRMNKEGRIKHITLYPLKRISFKIHGGYFAMPDILQDGYLRSMRCPSCNRRMMHESIECINKNKYLALCLCPTHGSFACHWYIGKEEKSGQGTRFFVVKTFTNKPKELEDAYYDKQEKNRIKRERMKEAQRRYYEEHIGHTK